MSISPSSALPKLLTGREVLDCLRLRPREPSKCLYTLRQRGLRAVKVGLEYRYPQSGLAEFLAARGLHDDD